MKIRVANDQDFEAIKEFYYKVIDAMESAAYKPGWEKDIYPTREMLKEAIHSNEMYIGTIENNIVSAMIVNNKYNEGYNEVSWPNEVEDGRIRVIHALGVDYNWSGKGLAKEMVREVFHIAEAENAEVIRLDVLDGNLPAEKAYLSLGFEYVDELKMYYEDTGWTNFKLFEYKLGGKK